MDSKQSIIVLVFTILFLASLVCIGIMLFTMIKRGDERKQYVISKSSTTTLAIYVGMVIIDVLYTFLVERNGGFEIESSSLITLAIISIIFCITFFCNLRKYGK